MTYENQTFLYAIPDIVRHPVEVTFIEIFYGFSFAHLPKFTKFKSIPTNLKQ